MIFLYPSPTQPLHPRKKTSTEPGNETYSNKMAANSAVEVIEPNTQDEILETTSPIASGRLTLSDTNVGEQAEITNEIVDEVEDAEIDSLLELKKCKEWLLQQKINQQSELLVRKFLVSTGL